MDAVFTGATVAFLLLMLAMVRGCEKLAESQGEAS
jgi:hypothetical protein